MKELRIFKVSGLTLALVAALAGVTAGPAKPPGALSLFDDLGDGTLPFEVGERLRYDVFWKPPTVLRLIIPNVRAGRLAISVNETQWERKNTLTIFAKATTTGWIRDRILAVDDQFESIVDRSDFRSYKFTKTIREGTKANRRIVTRVDYPGNRVLVEKTDLRKDPVRKEAETFPGVQGPLTDVLAVFYLARLKRLEPGQEYSIHLCDQSRPYQVRVKVLKREEVRTPIRKFKALKLSTVGGFFKDAGSLEIWYSEDDSRVPVRFQAAAKFGKVYGELVGIDEGSSSTSVVKVKNRRD